MKRSEDHRMNTAQRGEQVEPEALKKPLIFNEELCEARGSRSHGSKTLVEPISRAARESFRILWEPDPK